LSPSPNFACNAPAATLSEFASPPVTLEQLELLIQLLDGEGLHTGSSAALA
jgi:hypothetical protein